MIFFRSYLEVLMLFKITILILFLILANLLYELINLNSMS